MRDRERIEDIASRLAAAHPEATLACPSCTAHVRGRNLSRHLADVHAGGSVEAARWSGPDGRLVLRLTIAMGVVLACSGAVVVALGGMWPIYVLVPLVMLFLAAMGLAMSGRLHAQVALEGDALRLARALGGHVSVDLASARIEVGSLVERRSSAIDATHIEGATASDHRAGVYLRLIEEGGGTLTLGSRRGTGFRARWSADGVREGGRVRRWDVTLDPAALVAIEYLLAARERLRPR